MSMYSLSSCKLFWDAALDTKALLAWNSDTAVLAFRGTASLTNACSDLKVTTRPCYAQRKGVRCNCSEVRSCYALMLEARQLIVCCDSSPAT